MAKPATNIKKTSDFILAEYAQILAIIYDRERFRNGIIDCISKAKKATDSDEDNQLADQKTNELYESWYPANLSKIFFCFSALTEQSNRNN